jgi:NADH dehydrogenase
MSTAEPTRIVILGGGFGGLAAARELERLLPARANVEVTLVNRENFFLFTPMLHEVAASDLDLATIVSPLRRLLRRTRLFIGVVEEIDVSAQTVTVAHAAGQHRHALPYDHLVVALGAVTNFYDIPGLAERASTMKSLGDAIQLRNQLIAQLEEADFECSGDERRPLLTVLVAGGGFAGVETVAAVNDFVREAVRFYPNITQQDVRVAVVHAGSFLLPELGQELGTYTETRLAERGVDVILNTRVTGFDGSQTVLSNGSRIDARTIVWTAGISANPMLECLPCERSRGRIVVNAHLQSPGLPNVWAVGDCASITDPATGETYPPTAQHALREGAHVARNIVAELTGAPKAAFTFSTIGLLAAIGRRTGVANILGLKFSGFVAWWLWRTIYLAKLPRLEKKVRVALDWTLDMIFAKDLVQFGTHRAPTISRQETLALVREEPQRSTGTISAAAHI